MSKEGYARVPRRREAAYTPAVMIAKAVADNLAKASWIRRMFEEGARLKQERGADKVFDFTLGNPEIEPPAAVLEAARRVLDIRAAWPGFPCMAARRLLVQRVIAMAPSRQWMMPCAGSPP